MTIDGAQINRPARPAAWAEHIEPRRSGDHSMPRPVASRFQRSTTSSASRRAARSAFNAAHGPSAPSDFVLPRAYRHGHSAPLSIHAAMIAPNSSWVPGAGRRPGPGCHAQPTKSSFAMCSWSKARLRPPLRAGSLI
jgi:hypothetical protein